MRKASKKLAIMSICLVVLLNTLTAVAVSAATSSLCSYSFDTQEDCDKWQLQDQGTSSDKISFVSTGGWNGKGFMRFTATGDAARPRLREKTQCTWEKGKTYLISCYLKADAAQSVLLWIDTGSFVQINGGAPAQYPAKSLNITTEWKKYEWVVAITDLKASLDSTESLDSITAYCPLRFNGNNVAGILDVDDFSIADITDRIDSLDLSETKTVLEPGETSQISVKGIKGGASSVLTEGVAFVSSDSSVAEIAENGAVTAQKEGIAVITASYDGVEKSIVVIVGSNSVTNGYENSSDFTSSTEKETFDTTVYRTGKQSLKLDLSNGSGSLDNPVTLASKSDGLVDSDYGAVQLWFYDDMAEKLVFFQMMGNGGVGKPDYTQNQHQRINSWLKLYGTGSTYEMNNEPNTTYPNLNVTATVPRSKGWHQMIVSWKPDSVSVYVDGVRTNYRTEDLWDGVKINGLYLQKYETSGVLWIDDYAAVDTAVQPKAPVVQSVTIEGPAVVGQTLTANDVVIDPDNDELDSSLYQWQYQDGTEWKDIAGAAAKTYTITPGDEGRVLRVVVTPRSTVEPKMGEVHASSATNAVAAAAVAPSAKDISISGKAGLGNKLTAVYTYVPSESNIAEGDSQIVFEISDTENGTYTPIQTSSSKEYVCGRADTGKFIRVRVIPKDQNGLAGSEIVSAAVQISEEIAYYVSPDGDDSNAGSFDAPFKTIEKARDVVGNTPGVTVYLREGTYYFDKAVTFGAGNAGGEDSPIVYSAYNDEKVVFMGGKRLDTSKIKPVTDSAVLDRIIDPLAKQRVVQLDLGAQGITNIAPVTDHGMGYASAYRPEEVYFNGSALKNARWPNEEPGGGFTTIKTASYDNDGYRNMPFTVTYADEDNHTALWDTSKMKDLFLGGFVGYDWAQSNNKIAQIDTETKELTTVGGTSYAPRANQRIYFFNLLEEIDVPGESYIDRDTNILYFYPTGDTADAEMTIATYDGAMISVNGASDITFRGICFDTSRNTMVNIQNANRIRIEDCVFARGSSNAITMNANHSVITGCHVYEMGRGGIYVQGGDRKTLTGGENLIENNRIHSVNRVYNSSEPGIAVKGGVGHILRHNLVYDGPHTLIQLFGSNDVLIEYNEIAKGVQEAGDIGAIYWGRHPTEMGIVIRNNYFHEIGSEYDLGIGQQSVFWDDGASGPDMYGNIFYRGARSSDMGGTSSRNYALKGNGGQFANIHDNIFIDVPTPVYFQSWNVRREEFGNKGLPGQKQGRWFTYVQDINSGTNYMWNRLVQDTNFESETFQNHYADTQWAPLWDCISSEIHTQAVNFYNQGNTEGLYQLAVQYAPENSNVFQNNVTVKVDNPFLNGMNTASKASDNYNVDEASGKALFADYDEKDFSLTQAGLAQIQEKLPGFEAIPFSQMGLLTNVGGSEPSISQLRITGAAEPEGILSASYQFSDPDGDHQGASKIVWMISDSADGEFKRISGKQGKELLIDDSYAGRYVRCEVTPYDVNTLYGETAVSEAIKIRQSSDVNKSALIAALNQANSVLNSAVVGDQAGQYPLSAKNELLAVLEEAQNVANREDATQYAVNQAAAALEAAILKFESQQITAGDQFHAEITRMAVNSLLADSVNWNDVAGEHQFENGALVIEGDEVNQAWVTYTGRQFKNVEFFFKYKAEKKADDPTAWGGIYVRQSNPDGILWQGTNAGSMIDLKQDKIVFQEYPNIAIYDTLTDQHLEMGHEYVISVGMYDLSDEEKTAVVLTMDGKTIYAKELDSNALYGKEGYLGFSAGKNTKVTISPLYADASVLDQMIAEGEAFLQSAVAGTNYGQYPQTEINAVNTALTAAKSLKDHIDAVQSDVNKAAAALSQALVNAKAAGKTTQTITSNGTIAIHYDLPCAELTVEPGVSSLHLQVDPAMGQPDITVNADGVSMELQKGTMVSGDITVPLKGGILSGTFSSGTVSQVYGTGSNIVTADQPVRIVLEGQKGKQAAYKNGQGGYTMILKTVKTDSYEAAKEALANQKYRAVKIESGNDIVIYTYLLTEFITCSVNEHQETPTPTPNVPGNYGPSQSNGITSIGIAARDDDISPFADIVGHWAQKDINEMYQKGVVSGVTENTFEPDRAITRAEFAALVARALRITASSPAGFEDVPAGEWFASYVNAAAGVGLISGYNGAFRPNDLITREEMATVLAKAYAFLGYTPKTGGIVKFEDAEEISDWAYSYVDQMTASGLISGITSSVFAAKENTTRAQAASVLNRLLNQ